MSASAGIPLHRANDVTRILPRTGGNLSSAGTLSQDPKREWSCNFMVSNGTVPGAMGAIPEPGLKNGTSVYVNAVLRSLIVWMLTIQPQKCSARVLCRPDRIHDGAPKIFALILLGVSPSEIAKPFVLRFESKLALQASAREPTSNSG
jgi:hypothetical protein